MLLSHIIIIEWPLEIIVELSGRSSTKYHASIHPSSEPLILTRVAGVLESTPPDYSHSQGSESTPITVP